MPKRVSATQYDSGRFSKTAGRTARRARRIRNLATEPLETRRLLAGDLVAHWLADDLNATVADGAAVSGWVDSTAGIGATATGTPVLSKGALSGHSVVQFDPSDGVDYFQVLSRDSPLSDANDFSVTVAFLTSSTDLVGGTGNWYENTGLVDANLSNLGRGWGVTINQAGQIGGGLGAGFFEPASSVYSNESGLNDGQFHVTTLTRSGGTLSLYVDGGAASTMTGGDVEARAPVNVLFGALQTKQNFFTGSIAEVRFYHGAMTTAEVGTLHHQLDSVYNNQAPTAADDSYQLTEDPAFGFVSISAAQGLLANDSDTEGDAMTAVMLDPPQSITVNLAANGSMGIILPRDFAGTDSFTYTANDGQASNVATVTINVANVYDAATAVDDTYKLQPTETLNLTAAAGVLSNDLNPDRVSLTAMLASDVNQGTLTLRADGSLQFDPLGIAGRVTFTYQVHDQTRLSPPATVTLVVNTPPVAGADAFTVDEDTPLVRAKNNGLLANDSDADGNSLTVTLVEGPQHGTLTLGADGSLNYQPDADYFGTDRFTYLLSDGEDASLPAAVNLTIQPVNDSPLAGADTYFTPADSVLTVSAAGGLLANDSDIDSASLTASVGQGPTHGTLQLQSDGAFRYTPNAGFRGTDSFTYRAGDGRDQSAPAMVTLLVGDPPVVISEFMAANVDGLQTRVRADVADSFRGPMQHPDWIELHNVSAVNFDVGGYHLTDDPNNTTKWQIPAETIIPPGGYLVILGSDLEVRDPGLDELGLLHANLKLSLESEYLAIADPRGNILDDALAFYPNQVPNVAYGLQADGSPGYLLQATPGAANALAYAGRVPDTRFSIDRGFFSEPFQVAISTAMPEAQIRYTFDGSAPTAANGLVYSGPITIDHTTTLRAAAFRDGYLTADVDTQTYLFIDQVINQPAAPTTGPSDHPVSFPAQWRSTRADYEMDPEIINNPAYASQMHDALTALPTLSLTLAPGDIFESTGLYANPQSSAEEAASAELIFPDGTIGFQIDAGARMQGGASRNPEHYKHSMSLRFREDYGQDDLRFPLFDDSPVARFDSIHLRARYNNSWIHWDQGQRNRGSLIREMWMRDTMLAAGEVAAGHGRYVHLYLNGIYWGIYEMHERQDASHYANYFGGEAYQYDATNANLAVDGTLDSWRAMQDAVRAKDWDLIQQKLDVDNHIRFTIVNRYGGNQDLKGDGNWRMAGGGLADAPWQFYMWDAERVLENVNQRGTAPVNDLLNLLRDLDDIPEYMMRFADIIHEMFFNDGALTPENTAARWMKHANELDVAIIAESARWGDMRPDQGQRTPLERNDEWIAEQNRLLQSYFPQRSDVMLGQFRGSFYPVTAAPEFLVNQQRQHGGVVLAGDTLTVLNPNGDTGIIYYTTDGSDPRQVGGTVNPAALVYSGGPLPVSGNTRIRMRILNGAEWSAISDATFVTERLADATNLRITEINYHPHPGQTSAGEPSVDDREFEFLELRNVSDVPVNLAGAQLKQTNVDGQAEGVTYAFAPHVLQPGQSTVVVRNLASFAARYDRLGGPIDLAPGSDGVGGPSGQFGGGSLGNGGERLTLVDAAGELIQQFDYRDDGSWPSRADGLGSTLELIDPHADANDGSNWRASRTLGGTPGSSALPVVPSVVINELLTNSNAPVVDQIELLNLTNNPVDLSGWFISDTADELRRFAIPSGTTIPANGYRVFDQTQLGFGFKGQESDSVWLMAPAGATLGFADQLNFDASDANITLGRWPNGQGDLFPQRANSLNGPNTGPLPANVVLSELHYNGGLSQDGATTESWKEFVEVWNVSDAPLDISGWRLDKAVDYVFPAGTTLAPSAGLTVVGFDPVADPSRATAFRTAHAVASSVTLLGPYAGALDNGGERVELQRPVAGGDGFVLVDRVRYDDVAPWPTSADGQGDSLQRQAATSFGDAVTSWRASPPTPGTARFVADSTYDFNGDQRVDALDVDLACAAIRQNQPEFDLNGDGSLSADDVLFLVEAVLGTHPGDANVDGRFDSSDLVQVLAAGEYEDGVPDNSSWSEGDWNCDGDFTSSDLVSALAAGGYVGGAPVLDGLAAAAIDTNLAAAVEAVFATAGRKELAGGASHRKP